MRAVAIPTTRRAGRAERVAHAMDARGIFLRGFVVARLRVVATDTIRWRQFAFVDEVFDSTVAINAIKFSVNRLRKTVRRKNQRDNLPADFSRRGRIEVAIEAVRV